MHNPADFAPLFNHSRPMEKVLLAERLQREAMARKAAADDETNDRAVSRDVRLSALRETVSRQRSTGRPEPGLISELDELEANGRMFLRELAEARRIADERYQASVLSPGAALDWLGEQLADWRAAGKPKGAWLVHKAGSLKGNKASTEQVRELRAEIVKIEAEARDISRRPVTAAELKANANAALASLSDLGYLEADPHSRGGDPFRLVEALTAEHFPAPARQDQGDYRFSHLARGATPRPINGAAAVLVWLFQPELREALHERIDALDLTGALSSEQQDRELARLATKRLMLERSEEAAIVALEAEGIPMARRPDLDPRAFLEVEEL